MPGPPVGATVAGWDLGPELLGRPGCADAPDGVHCAAAMTLAPEEPVNMSRTLTVPQTTTVAPTVWVMPRQGPKLADLIREPGKAYTLGDADLIDVLGSAYAAADGDPRTSWTAPPLTECVPCFLRQCLFKKEGFRPANATAVHHNFL